MAKVLISFHSHQCPCEGGGLGEPQELPGRCLRWLTISYMYLVLLLCNM